MHSKVWKLLKSLFFQDHHNQPKVETVKNQLFQDHHNHPK